MKAKDGRPFEPGVNEPPAWARPLLYVGSLAFSAGARVNGWAYDHRVRAQHRLAVPVISVGNLTVGGSGKTPFTMLIVQELLRMGHRPAVISRGYGRTESTTGPLVVSTGAGPEVSVARSGDEPALIALRSDAAVVVDAHRARGGQQAIDALGATVIVLDDGFQHRALARDLDIVLVDARRPLGNGHALPRGPLREPAQALARAHLLVVNHGDAVAESVHLPEVARALHRVDIRTRATGVGRLDGPHEDPSSLAGVKVGLLCGIARPARFEDTVKALGAQVVHRLVLPDHAVLAPEVVRTFALQARERGAERLLTTEKDAVRLAPEHQAEFEALCVAHEVIDGQDALMRALQGLGAS